MANKSRQESAPAPRVASSNMFRPPLTTIVSSQTMRDSHASAPMRESLNNSSSHSLILGASASSLGCDLLDSDSVSSHSRKGHKKSKKKRKQQVEDCTDNNDIAENSHSVDVRRRMLQLKQVEEAHNEGEDYTDGEDGDAASFFSGSSSHHGREEGRKTNKMSASTASARRNTNKFKLIIFSILACMGILVTVSACVMLENQNTNGGENAQTGPKDRDDQARVRFGVTANKLEFHCVFQLLTPLIFVCFSIHAFSSMPSLKSLLHAFKMPCTLDWNSFRMLFKHRLRPFPIWHLLPKRLGPVACQIQQTVFSKEHSTFYNVITRTKSQRMLPTAMPICSRHWDWRQLFPRTSHN